MICNIHNLEINYILNIPNDKKNYYCNQCLNQNHNIKEKIKSQMIKPENYDYLKNILNQNIIDMNKEFNKYKKYLNEETEKINNDYKNINKIYSDFTNMGFSYLNNSLKKNDKNLNNNYNMINEKYEKIKNYNIIKIDLYDNEDDFMNDLLDINNNFFELDNCLYNLNQYIKIINKNKIYYKNTSENTQAYDLLILLFQNFMKSFLRKFKKLLNKNDDILNIDLFKNELKSLLNTLIIDCNKSQFNMTSNMSIFNNINDNNILKDNFKKIDKINIPDYEKDINDKFGKFKLKNNIMHPYRNDLVLLDQPIIYNDGNYYEGHFYDNKKNGYGRQLYSDLKSIYEGYFLNDIPHFYGRFISDKKELYEGSIKDGKSFGKGFFKNFNNYEYNGFWKNNKKNGKGKEIFSDSSYFEGTFLNDKKSGFGKFVKKNNEVYEGNFLDNKFNGYGKYIWSENEKYEGGWYNGKKHGKGIYYYENGNIYDGDFCEDLQNGFGELKLNNKSIFKGFWKDGDYINE